MSRKFSFLVVIQNDKPVTEAFVKDDTHIAKEKFNKARDAGKEAYLYLLPLEDKRCKSSEQAAASSGKSQSEEKKPSAVKDFMETAKSVVKPKKADDLAI